MLRSPLDQDSSLVSISIPLSKRWRPSQFNARSKTADHSILLWNTLTGSFSVIPPNLTLRAEHLLSQKGVSGDLDSLGLYLLRRGYLVPSREEELNSTLLRLYTEHFRDDVLELILLASEDCNFRCRYCYEDFPRGTMSAEVCQAVILHVKAKLPRLRHLSISWFGGEPLYGWAAIDVLAPALHALANDNGLTFASSMTTNGYLLTPDKFEFLVRYGMRKFQITIDGLEDQHDVSRPGREGAPTWRVIMDNLIAMHHSEQEFLVNLRLNVDLANQPFLRPYIDYLRETFEGDHRFVLNTMNVGQWGGDGDHLLEVQSRSEAARTRDDVEMYAQQCGVPHGTILDGNRVGSGVCYAARPYSFIVGADGKLMKCTVALGKEESNIVGQLMPDGEAHIEAARLKKWVEPSFAHDLGCQSCHMLPSCQGLSCPLIRHHSGERPCEATPKFTLQSALRRAYSQRMLRS